MGRMSATTVEFQVPAEPLITPQSIIAIMAMLIVAGTVAAALMLGDASMRSQTVGGVMAIGSAVTGFYFGSSSGSQKKDAALAAASKASEPVA